MYLGQAQGFKQKFELPRSKVLLKLIRDDIKENRINEKSIRPNDPLHDEAIRCTALAFQLPQRVPMLHLNDVFDQDLPIWSSSPGLPWSQLGYKTKRDIRKDPEAIQRVRYFWHQIKLGRNVALPDCSYFTQLGSVCNHILLKYATLKKGVEIESILVFGDDSLMGTNGLITPDDVQNALEPLGMVVNVEKSGLSRNVTNLTFLGYKINSNTTNIGGFPQRYPFGDLQPLMSFPQNNLMTSMSGTAVTGNNNPNIPTLQVQKYLNQGEPHNVNIGGPQSVNSNTPVAFCQNASNASQAVNIALFANNQPSGQHIRMLGQQIQLAIHSGFISSQILTQPLTLNTLNLLNQLLSSIKLLQAAQQSLSRGGNANPMVVNVTIAKYKQQIQNFQNQINAQQSVYIKEQNLQQNSQQQQQPSGRMSNSGSDYLRNHDAIATLQGNFSELNLNKPSGYQVNLAVPLLQLHPPA